MSLPRTTTIWSIQSETIGSTTIEELHHCSTNTITTTFTHIGIMTADGIDIPDNNADSPEWGYCYRPSCPARTGTRTFRLASLNPSGKTYKSPQSKVGPSLMMIWPFFALSGPITVDGLEMVFTPTPEGAVVSLAVNIKGRFSASLTTTRKKRHCRSTRPTFQPFLCSPGRKQHPTTRPPYHRPSNYSRHKFLEKRTQGTLPQPTHPAIIHWTTRCTQM